jgi:hypothetical protein
MKAMGRVLAFGVLLSAPALGAQDASSLSSSASVQVLSYTLKRDGVENRISELVVPIAAVYRPTDRLSFDIASAYARATSEATGAPMSRISGLTDTQVRASWIFGDDAIVLTGGVNLPTGQATATESQFRAAGQIGNDFLLFPISSMGSGLAATGGIAVAHPLGSWNVGAGASFRYASEYEPYEFNNVRSRYQPGSEYRARLGVDRPIRAGRFVLGTTYSAFGADQAGGQSFNTGDRFIVQASFDDALGGSHYTVSAWNLHRTSGTHADGSKAGAENITNAMVGLAIPAGGMTLEPSVESRLLSRSGSGATSSGDNRGHMETAGLRARWTAGPLQIAPGATYSLGRLEGYDLMGWRAMLTVRITP